MFKLPVRTWILNAAAVILHQHGAVTRQAERSGCSRGEAVYQHAQKVEQRLVDESVADVVAELRAENQRLREAITQLQREAMTRSFSTRASSDSSPPTRAPWA